MIELEDMAGNLFTEGDYVMFADSTMSLRIAKVRAIKYDGGSSFMVAIEIVEGMYVTKQRYSRRHHPSEWYKIDYTTKGDS